MKEQKIAGNHRKGFFWGRFGGGLLLLLCAGMTSARATLISQEQFNYTAGSVSGANGGTGWTSAWGAPLNITAGSLAYPSGVTLTPAGGAAALAAGSNISRNYATNGDFSFSTDTVRYMSLLITKADNGSSSDFEQVILSDASYADEVIIGIGSGEGFTLTANTSDAGTKSFGGANSAAASGTTYLLVLKIVSSASGTDAVYLKAYSPTDTVDASDPTTWTASGTFTSSETAALTKLSIQTGSNVNLSGSASGVDEIMFGTTWGDVVAVPEPHALGLALFSTLALIAGGRFASARSALGSFSLGRT